MPEKFEESWSFLHKFIETLLEQLFLDFHCVSVLIDEPGAFCQPLIVITQAIVTITFDLALYLAR